MRQNGRKGILRREKGNLYVVVMVAFACAQATAFVVGPGLGLGCISAFCRRGPSLPGASSPWVVGFQNAALHGRSGSRRPGNPAAGVSLFTMTVSDWRATCHPNSDEGLLGCMPFPLADLLLPGEQKRLHLYEARFLALFEASVKNHGSCIGQLGYFEEGELAATAVLCEILEWRRMDVGVFIRMRAASRVTVKGVVQGDPYIMVSAVEVLDEERGEEGATNTVPMALADRLYQEHAEVVRLTLQMDKAPVAKGQQVNVEWGHEATDTSHCFRTDLRSQLRMHQNVLAENKVLESDGEAQEHMWKLPTSQLEELQLLSFVALAGLDPEVRMWAIDQASTKERLEKGIEMLVERKNILLAKMALSNLKFD